LATKGSRVLEKKVNETQVSKTVFSHLKFYFNYRTKNKINMKGALYEKTINNIKNKGIV